MDNLSVYWESIPAGRENDVATERKGDLNGRAKDVC